MIALDDMRGTLSGFNGRRKPGKSLLPRTVKNPLEWRLRDVQTLLVSNSSRTFDALLRNFTECARIAGKSTLESDRWRQGFWTIRIIPTYSNSTRQVKVRRFGVVSPTDAKVDLKDTWATD